MEPPSPAEAIVELIPRVDSAGPAAPAGPPRLVGPGRRERAYLAKLGGLEDALAVRERALAAAALVERGSVRRLDRMEKKLEALREAALAVEQREHRLILALGGLQRENEMLRERSRRRELGAGGPRLRALPAPGRSLLARLFRRA